MLICLRINLVKEWRDCDYKLGDVDSANNRCVQMIDWMSAILMGAAWGLAVGLVYCLVYCLGYFKVEGGIGMDIEQARLTKEEIASTVSDPWNWQFADSRRTADAATEKALWWMVEWMQSEDVLEVYDSQGRAVLLGFVEYEMLQKLKAAGIERKV